jgi:hypothetical protein
MDPWNVIKMYVCKYLCQLLNAQGVKYVRQNKIHITEPLVPEPTFLELNCY